MRDSHGALTSRRRLLIVVVALVAASFLSIALTHINWSAALRSIARASTAQRVVSKTLALKVAFRHEALAAVRYLESGSSAARAQVRSEHLEFRQVAAAIRPEGGEQVLLAQAVRRESAYNAEFNSLAGRIRAGRVSHSVAVRRLVSAADSVTAPVEALARRAAQRTRDAQQVAAESGGRADAIEIFTDVAGVLSVIGFALYALRLLRLGERREEDLAGVVASLSDRDDLVARLETAAGVLCETSGHIVSAADDTSVVVKDQFAAVTRTSDLIDDFTATAATITENVRHAAQAVERVGDTMGGMREKAEAVAGRAVSLGEQTQKIGGIVELINDIAAQTTMLATNAAIEAARAGEAGKGFGVVATEVRKLAERSVQSTESISAIITGIRDQMNDTIMAAEEGARNAVEVADLMAGTVAQLQRCIKSTGQQRSAAEQVSGAIAQIKEAAEHLAAGQAGWADMAHRLEGLVEEINAALQASDGPADTSFAPAASTVALSGLLDTGGPR